MVNRYLELHIVSCIVNFTLNTYQNKYGPNNRHQREYFQESWRQVSANNKTTFISINKLNTYFLRKTDLLNFFILHYCRSVEKRKLAGQELKASIEKLLAEKQTDQINRRIEYFTKVVISADNFPGSQ